MLRIFTSPYLVIALSLIFSPTTFAKEHDKEQIKKDFDAWYAKTTAEFEESWTKIMAAEAKAEPVFAKGVKLAEAAKTKKAIKTLLDARGKLFNGPNGDEVQIHKGLSFKIATALAELYEKLEDEPRLKRETSFMDVARPWMSKEQEQQIFMHYAIKELYRVFRMEEAKSGKRMKSKERKRLHRIMSYLVVGTTDVIFEEGYRQAKAWQKTAEAAEKTYAVEAFEDFGGQGDVEPHSDIMAPAESNFPKGGVVLVVNREVSSVTKKGVIFDFTESRLMPVNCKSTGKVLKVTNRGRFIYKQKCDFRAREGGHKLIVKRLKGLKLKKGDVVTMYVPVEKVIRSKMVVKMGIPAVVHSSRKGKTQWLLGVKTKKPSFIEKDGSYRVLIRDDAEAPPKVK